MLATGRVCVKGSEPGALGTMNQVHKTETFLVSAYWRPRSQMFCVIPTSLLTCSEMCVWLCSLIITNLLRDKEEWKQEFSTGLC